MNVSCANSFRLPHLSVYFHIAALFAKNRFSLKILSDSPITNKVLCELP